MIGIMTAAGKGTRMKALTGKDIPKVLLKLNKKTIIEYGIESLEQMGATKIYIVINENYINDFKNELGGYKDVVLIPIPTNNHIMESVDSLSKYVLAKEPNETKFVYWLADNIFIGENHIKTIKSLVNSIDNVEPTTGLILVNTSSPQDFITMNNDGTFSDKPSNPETNISASGVFVVNRKALKDTDRREMNENLGEYAIWDSWMKAHKIISEETTDIWIDVGTPERYFEIQKTFK